MIDAAAAAEGLPALVKDRFEIISKSVAILGGIVLATKAVIELANARKQRVRELRWQQSKLAREVLTEIHADPNAMAALSMLDWGEGRHVYHPKQNRDLEIAEADVERALARERTRATEPVDEFVWHCFDWLFYRIDRLEHYVQTHLLVFADIEDVFRPYVARVALHPERYEQVLASQGYDKARLFLKRFEGPRAAA